MFDNIVNLILQIAAQDTDLDTKSVALAIRPTVTEANISGYTASLRVRDNEYQFTSTGTGVSGPFAEAEADLAEVLDLVGGPTDAGTGFRDMAVGAVESITVIRDFGPASIVGAIGVVVRQYVDEDSGEPFGAIHLRLGKLGTVVIPSTMYTPKVGVAVTESMAKLLQAVRKVADRQLQ